ncbi:hypothetical protein [Clostridioides difficile]
MYYYNNKRIKKINLA